MLWFWLFFRSVFRFLGQNTAVFRFSRSLRSADFSFFSIWFSVSVINTLGFSVLASDVVFGFSFFVLFGFRFLFDLSAIDLENVAAKRQTYLEESVRN